MDDIKDPLVAIICTVDKDGNIHTADKKMISKPNIVEESITSPISSKKNIDTVNKTEKSQTSQKTVPTSKNKLDTLNSIYKSRSIQRTNLSNKSTRIEKPTEIYIL